MLAELYFDAVPTALKKRFHFHNFFRELQAEIFSTRQPVERSIRKIIGKAQVVFFDEFHVHDVADAVYLTKTLEVLLELNVFVLATSNYAPGMLMPDPLFHDRFIPAIALIESNFEIVPLGAGTDYRRVAMPHGRTGFGTGSGTGFNTGEWRVAPATTPIAPRSSVELTVNGLAIHAVATGGAATVAATAVFTFAELCERPLGTNEYLQLAEDFDSIKLIAVPDLATASLNSLMRLCNLVDVFYFRDRRLDVEAHAEPERMREAIEPPPDMARTLSRLATLSLVSTDSLTLTG